MISKPLVSIVVRTCHGRQAFLRQALGSLVAQTYRPLEVLVIEDGSCEASPLVAEIAGGAGLPIVHHCLAKSGRCAAGNLGLALSRGALLGFLDDDDLLLPNHVQLLAQRLADQPGAVAACALACEVPTQILSAQPCVWRDGIPWVPRRRPYSTPALARRNLFPVQAVLFRRALYERCGGFDERLDYLEDWDLWQRYAAVGPFEQVWEITSLYRVPGDAQTARQRQLRFEQAKRRVLAKETLSAQCRPQAAPFAAARHALMSRLKAALLASPRAYAIFWHLRQLRRRLRQRHARACFDQYIHSLSRSVSSRQAA